MKETELIKVMSKLRQELEIVTKDRDNLLYKWQQSTISFNNIKLELKTQIEFIEAMKLREKEMEEDLIDLSVTIKIIKAAVDPYDRFEKK